MNKKLVISFDIDTHKCIRDGVPNLLKLSEEMNVKFSFFLNGGKAVSIRDSIRQIFFRDNTETALHMNAFSKLGMKDYIIAAIVKPNLAIYKKQIRALIESSCEVGLHGGKNHALWANYAQNFDENQIKSELNEVILRIRRFAPDFDPKGFASPNWNTPDFLPRVLKELGFEYYRDRHGLNEKHISYNDALPQLYVNLLGEPGGVAFFENERAKKHSTEQILQDVRMALEHNNVTVLYDHPYFAGVNEIHTLRRIINMSRENGTEICTLRELVSCK